MDSIDFLVSNLKPQLCSQHNLPIQTFNRMEKPLCQICLQEQSGMTPVEEIQKKLQQTLRNARVELDGQRQSLQTLIESFNNHKDDLVSELEKIITNIKNQIIYMNQSEEQLKLICFSKINQLQCIEEIEGQQLIGQQKDTQFRSLIIQKLQDFKQKFINIDHLLKQINVNKNVNQKQANTNNKIKVQVKNQEDSHIPVDSEGFFKKGNSLAQLSKYQDAIQCYDQAIKLNPEHFFAIQNRQMAIFKLKEKYPSYDEY